MSLYKHPTFLHDPGNEFLTYRRVVEDEGVKDRGERGRALGEFGWALGGRFVVCWGGVLGGRLGLIS